MSPLYATKPDPSFARKIQGFEITPCKQGTSSLRVWGRLPPGWVGNLSSGLSRNSINIISATARKENLSWSAEFQIAPKGCTDLDTIDYVALATDEISAEAPVNFSLDELLFGEPDRHQGSLYLEIKARDQLGFLGALLNQLSLYSLFPESMIIETVNSKVFDRFWIKGIGGSSPSANAMATLKRRLESCIK